MVLTCYICSTYCRDTDQFLTHLRRFHSIESTGQEVRCGQNGCPRRFTCFKPLRHHLAQHVNDSTVLLNEESQADSMSVDEIGDSITTNIEQKACENGQFNGCTNDKQQLQSALLSFVCAMGSKPNMTMSNVLYVVEQLQEFLDIFVEVCCSRIAKHLKHLSVSHENVTEVCELVRDIPNVVESVGSKYKIEKMLQEQGLFIPPVEVVLGTREERLKVNGSVSTVNVLVEETMQYVPLGHLLYHLSKKIPDKSVLCVESDAHNNGLIADFTDTETFRNNAVCQRHPDAFRIHLFIDAFETCNELGSHSGIHKLEGMYMQIRNLPSTVQAQLNNIFLVGLWYAQDVKKYGYDKVLRPVVDDLKRLESVEGLCVFDAHLHGTLILFSADNLGAHSVFGFLESFSARKFCRLCEAVKTDKKFLETDLTLRTPKSYDSAVNLLHSHDYNPSLTGIKAGCILNEIPSFHVTTNYALDAMHDLLEGIIPFELQKILPMLLREGYFTDAQLQSLVINFNYGPADQNSKPPFTSSANIRVKAAEAWCLLRCLPLMLGNLIPRADPYWKILMLLCEITDIIFAPRYSPGLCQYLASLIDEHHQMFQHYFPDCNLLPKHHFLVHYPRCMLLSGPPVQYWCMRFEARHNFFKELARISRCFKNICKTLAKRCQFALASASMHEKLFTCKMNVMIH